MEQGDAPQTHFFRHSGQGVKKVPPALAKGKLGPRCCWDKQNLRGSTGSKLVALREGAYHWRHRFYIQRSLFFAPRARQSKRKAACGRNRHPGTAFAEIAPKDTVGTNKWPQPQTNARATPRGATYENLVDVGRGAKFNFSAAKWGFPTKPQ